MLCIFAPAAKLTREVAGPDFFRVHAAWCRFEESLTKTLKENDFVDHPRKETQNDVKKRGEDIAEMLQRRGTAFCTPAHLAAFALDPRLVHMDLDPQCDVLAGFDFKAARQKALSKTIQDFLPAFFPLEDWSLQGVGRVSRRMKWFCVLAMYRKGLSFRRNTEH